MRADDRNHITICGLFYKCFTIVIYNCNDSSQVKTTITIVIDVPS